MDDGLDDSSLIDGWLHGWSTLFFAACDSNFLYATPQSKFLQTASTPVAAASSTKLFHAAFFAASLSAAAAFASTTTHCDSSSPPVYGIPGTNKERTFIAVKPDGVQRGLIGDIIARFEKRGYKLVGLKMVWPTLEMAKEHYADLSKKPFYPGLTKFFSSGPIVCMCWEGKDVIKQGRQMLGEVGTNDLFSCAIN